MVTLIVFCFMRDGIAPWEETRLIHHDERLDFKELDDCLSSILDSYVSDDMSYDQIIDASLESLNWRFTQFTPSTIHHIKVIYV